MRITSVSSTGISSRGLRRHLMDGYNYYYNSKQRCINDNTKTDLLTVIKRR